MHHDTVASTLAGIAHGGCAEPGGMSLMDAAGPGACPCCGQPVRWWHCERVEDGSINAYSGLTCAACGHSEGDRPDQDD